MPDKKAIKTILVEPRQEVRKPFFKHLKSRKDVVVKTAKTAEEGLAKVRRYSPDLAVIYKDLPKMNGVELAWRMKEEHHSVVLLVTSSEFTPDEREFMSRVPDLHWLEAPRTLRDIVEKMVSIMKEMRGAGEGKRGKKLGKDGSARKAKKKRRIKHKESPAREEDSEEWPEPTRILD